MISSKLQTILDSLLYGIAIEVNFKAGSYFNSFFEYLNFYNWFMENYDEYFEVKNCVKGNTWTITILQRDYDLS